MTYQRREEIFSKDAISLDEMTELLGVSKSTACREIQFSIGSPATGCT